MINLRQPETTVDLIDGLVISPFVIPDDIDTIRFSLEGSTLLDKNIFLKLKIDFSLNNGKTWASEEPGPNVNPFPVEIIFQGGDIDRSSLDSIAKKLPLLEYFWNSPVIPEGKGRMVKGNINVLGTKLSTILSVKGYFTGNPRVK